MLTADEIIKLLGLEPHPAEGGYFRETYRCAESAPAESLPARYGEPRSFSTAIYYLLTPDTCSRMHRVASDEVFHFYLGDPVTMLQLRDDGSSDVIALGPDIAAGERLQLVVPGGVWQGSCLADGGDCALMGTTVAPGFDYADYEDGDRQQLIAAHPEHRDLIESLT